MARALTAASAAFLAAVLLLTGCASSSPAPDEHGGGASTPPAATGASGEAGDLPTLYGVVGSSDDPEAYAIGILDESGAVVTSVPAGDYALTFADDSQMHNFHLTGEGVDVATAVQGTDASTVEITLLPGTYDFVCDPHEGTMRGALEVTG